jgi:adenylate cyclase
LPGADVRNDEQAGVVLNLQQALTKPLVLFADVSLGAFERVRKLHAGLRIPLAVKFAAAIGFIITLTMTLLGGVIVHNQTQILDRQVHATGRTVVAQMAKSTTEPLLAKDTLLLDVLTANLATAEDVLGAAVFTADRKLISSAGNFPFETNAPYAAEKKSYLDDAMRTLEWQWDDAPRGPIDAIAFISPVRFKDTVVGFVVISFSRDNLRQSINDTKRSILSATTIMILFGIAVAYLIGRLLYKPICQIKEASRAISMGRYDHQIETARNDELGDLANTLNITARSLKLKSMHMAQGIRQRKQIANALQRHLPANVAREIIDNNNPNAVTLGGSHVNASVVFMDIVGFTAVSEIMTPQKVAELLSDFYGTVAEIAPLYKGTIDKFIGDAAMVIFGIAEADEQHAFHAIAFSVFFLKLMNRVNRRRIVQGKLPLHFRVGINAGDMLAGYIGSSERVQYTVVGDAVNIASRLCSVAASDQILITEDTLRVNGLADKLLVMPYESIQVRNKSHPLSTYLVHDVGKFYQAAMERQIKNVLTELSGSG